ncbi:IS3 family transposase [Caproiciproducens galactitolivorans]
MCNALEVSRSGYYAWRNRQTKAAKDQWLTDLILDCQQRCKQTYGCRRVRRWIQRQTGKNVNLKAILRIMRSMTCFHKYVGVGHMCITNKQYINIQICCREYLSNPCPIISGLPILPTFLL